MSKVKILQVIKRALDDSDFANNLYANPEKALRGFNLSSHEIDLIKNMRGDSLEKFAFELEDRLNKDDDWWIGSLQD